MNVEGSTHLIAVRQEIDKIDASIWSLLQKRFILLKEVTKIKSNYDLPVWDQKRENDVLTKIENLACDKETSLAICEVYKIIFDLSKKYQCE